MDELHDSACKCGRKRDSVERMSPPGPGAVALESQFESDPEIAALFAAAPRVEINRQPGSGHNLSLGVAAADYHSGVLSFVEQCIACAAGDLNREAG